MQDALVAWSGGKDSAYALHRIQQRDDIRVKGLLTTISADYDRVSIHGTPTSLVERQAAHIGVPLITVATPAGCSCDEYDTWMTNVLADHASSYDAVVYADIYLDYVKESREQRLEAAGLNGYWPLWRMETAALADAQIREGMDAVIVSVDGNVLDRSFTGRTYDHQFLADLPDGIDPCGEDGEFHTFVRDGPMFETPVPATPGTVHTRSVGDGTHGPIHDMHYCDITLTEEEPGIA